MKGKKILILVLVLLVLVLSGLGIWYFTSHKNAQPVYVYPFHYIGMTEYWGDSRESYGPVTTDKIQTVFLSETQEVTEITVQQGDSVKKGDLLLTFDTTLSDLQLERKRLEVEKLRLDLQKAEKELREINSLVPLESIQMEDSSFYYDENLGPMISGGYEIPENLNYNGSSEYQPLILWLSNSQNLNQAVLAAAQEMARYLQTMSGGQQQEDGSVLYQPPSVDSFYVVVRVTENDQQYATKTTWQGLHVSSGDYSFRFFSPMVGDPLDESGGGYQEPAVDYSSYYTAEQIAKMRADTQKKIKDLNFQIKMADAEYRIMLTEMSDGNVYADIDGKVVSVLDPEEAKSTRQPLVKVSGGGGFYVEGYVNELEKDILKPGMEVSVNDWYTGSSHTGEIVSVGDFPSQEASFDGTGNPNSSYYPFRVFVDGEADLKSGGYASITYAPTEGQTGIYLENPFLRTEDGESYVLVLGADAKLEKRIVTTGKSLWGNYTEVRSGLSTEDLIAFPYGKNVKPGVKAVEGDLSNLYG